MYSLTRQIRAGLCRPQWAIRARLPVLQTYHSYYRYMSASSNGSSQTELPKPKPKATTTLRRSASDSLPFRNTTHSGIHPVFTLATAERYVLSRLRGRVKSAHALHESLWISDWKGGEIFIFSNGCVVCWGLDESAARSFARDVISPTSGVEIGHLVEPETEDLEFVIDSNEKTRLQGDLIILGEVPPLNSTRALPDSLPSSSLPSESLLVRYAFSHALSRSTALSTLEIALEKYLSSVEKLPHSLEETGKPGLGRKAVIQKLGELLKFRQSLILNRENFSDTPEFYWGENQLEQYFISMSDALEVKARTAAVNEKITYAAEVQSVLRQLLTESSTHRMELIIIALITVEVVIAIIREGPELWHKLTGSAPDSHREAVDAQTS